MSALLSQPVVIDNGTGVVKAGMAGGDRPGVVFASACGRAKHVRLMPGGALEGADVVVGRRAAQHRGALVLSRPMARGMVESWADMERVWAHCYGDEGLGVASDAHPLLLTEAPLNAARHRERAAELLFESFNVPALHLAPQATRAARPDCTVSFFDSFDARPSAALRELDESHRFVQESAESTSIRPSSRVRSGRPDPAVAFHTGRRS